MAEKTIIQYFGHKPVKAWTNAKAVPMANPCPHLLYGLELEIENASNEWAVSGMNVTEDGSLRNNGLEFITQPATYSNIAYILKTFFDKAQPRYLPPTAEGEDAGSNYSDRTSIHVHTNVQDLTFTQLACLCFLYEVFERLLFRFIGNDRDKNIFTVPWSETTLSYSVVSKLAKAASDGDLVVRKWQKYTALNLLPVQEQGTVEWRHMHGNADLPYILTWLRLIGHMYSYALSTELDKLKAAFNNLNTTSAYDAILDTVFKDDADRLRCHNYSSLLEEGILDMKYALLEEQKAPKVDINKILAELEGQANNLRNEMPRQREQALGAVEVPEAAPHRAVVWDEVVAQREPLLARDAAGQMEFEARVAAAQIQARQNAGDQPFQRGQQINPADAAVNVVLRRR